MADSAYTLPEIYIDLTSTGARTITTGVMNIAAIKINGTSGAGAGDIVLRDGSAGPIAFKENAPAATSFAGTDARPWAFSVTNGLYMDALANAWAAGSFMIIYRR